MITHTRLAETEQTNGQTKGAKMISQVKIDYHGVVVSKKNSKVIRVNRHTGQRFITSNDIAKRNEAEMVAQFREQTLGIFKAEEWSPCSLEFRMYEPDLKRRDLDNQITSVLDALVKAGVLVDDSITTVRGITVRLMGVAKDNPRVEVILTKEQGAVPCVE